MIRFHKGMKFRSLRDLQVRGGIAYCHLVEHPGKHGRVSHELVYDGPESTSFEANLPAGEVLICHQTPGPQDMWLVPERLEHFERLFISSKCYRNPAYVSYAINCSFNQIGLDFEIIGE